MLQVFHPPTYPAERTYIFGVLLGDFLGLEYQARPEERNDVRIILQNESLQREVTVSDILFQTPRDKWLTNLSLPRRPLQVWDISDSPVKARVVSSRVPVIYGEFLDNNSFCRETEVGIKLGIDIFGSAFFMLTRYEEVVDAERDALERYPAKASLAYREGLLKRPVVNEYLEILWWAINKLWPGIQRKKRQFRLSLSHDVDWPYCTKGRSLIQILKSAAGDLVVRKDLKLCTGRLHSFFEVKRGNLDADIGNNFDFIMDVSEKHGLKSCFNFITGHSGGALDGNYCIYDLWIRGLMRKIHQRGHEIGFHPSFNTFRDPIQTRHEFETLLQVAGEEGIYQPAWGGRQHYLRWENPTTWQIWEDTGLAYDSTLTFADHSGFRCGTCYDYPTFNLRTSTPLKLREYPLIVMEVTLRNYMGFSLAAMFREILELKRICAYFHGNFTLLWHNTSLLSDREKEQYMQIISKAATYH